MALILGTKIGEHDATFALLKDGKLLGVYEEERFNCIKYGQSCSAHGSRELLQDNGYTLCDLDYITNCIDPRFKAKRIAQMQHYLAGQAPDFIADICAGIEWTFDTFGNLLRAHTGKPEKIIHVRHQLCHIAGVYYPSPSTDAAIISIDGGGEAETIVLARGQESQIEILRHNSHPHSLGHLYLAATNWLGWGYGEEGKTMALASYGEPRHIERLQEFVHIDEDGFVHCRTNEPALVAILRLFGKARGHAEEITAFHQDVAATLQSLTNTAMVRLSRLARRMTRSSTLIITGGVALNSVANGKIMEQNLFDTVEVYPHANDSGTAIGGAYWIEQQKGGWHKSTATSFQHAYHGRDIDLHNLQGVAAKYQLTSRVERDPARWAAERIAAGGIVGWIQGRAEIGPRALGNRSILASPQLAEMKETINRKIKNREIWRPFAPSVLAEDTSVYFETSQTLPYMVIVARVKAEWQSRLPAITHVDGTARVQSVEEAANPLYHALLSELKQLTGIGMVLNTSFHDKGEPVINTVDQAVRLFLRSDMDALVIGNHVFESKAGTRRDQSPFSPFLYSIALLNELPSVHVTTVPGMRPLAEFRGFLQIAARELESVSFDPDLMTPSLLQELAGITIPSRWNLGQPKPEAAFVILGPRGGHEWAFDRKIASSTALSGLLAQARAENRAVYGVDCEGGITDLSILRSLLDWTPAGVNDNLQ